MSIFEDGQTWAEIGKRLVLASDAELRVEASALAAQQEQLILEMAPVREREKSLRDEISKAEELLESLQAQLKSIDRKVIRSGYRDETMEKSRRLMDEEILRRFYAALRGF